MQANRFDRRVIPYHDVFLLHPVMPPAAGATGSEVMARAVSLNRRFSRLNWEIEDLISEDFLLSFENTHPEVVVRRTRQGSLTHRDFTRQGKVDLVEYVKRNAGLADMLGLVRLVCRLRDYVGLEHEYISIADTT